MCQDNNSEYWIFLLKSFDFLELLTMLNFDLDVLRTFVTGMEMGSFAKAAERIGRSTSAISAQLRKLEEQAGTRIFNKAGRGLALTEAGETLLAYAKRLLELNDEAASALQDVKLDGWVRLGLQQDFADTLLPAVLGRFSRAHPKVKIEARLGRNAELLNGIASGALDLVLAWEEDSNAAYVERLASLPMCWIGSANQELNLLDADEIVPLTAFDGYCPVRAAATSALEKQGRRWRIAFTSPGLNGLLAASAAGLALSVRTRIGLPANVRVLEAAANNLPQLPNLSLILYGRLAKPDPLRARLMQIIRDAVAEELRA
jgi:DNA-binding transcriptional LysR family regulator